MAMERVDPDDFDRIRRLMGPGAVDRQLREIAQLCWMSLPQAEQNIDSLEREMRRMMDRMFRDMRDDENRGRGPTPSPSPPKAPQH